MSFLFISLAVMMLSAPQIDVSERSFDFGYGFSGQDYRHSFWVYNRGDEPLEILSMRVFCDCSVTTIGTRLIGPGDSTYFDFVFETLSFYAERVKWVYVRSNDPVDSLLMLNVTIKLYGDYERTGFNVSPQYLLLKSDEEISLTLTNPTPTDYTLRLVEAPSILDIPDFTEASFGPAQEVTIPVRLRPGSWQREDFKSSITFEAYTPFEIVRFSVPLVAP